MQYTLECLYFDEVQKLIPLIKARQTSEYKMQLTMIENPHKEKPGELWDILDKQDDTHVENEELDKTAFANFKSKIAAGGGLVVK